MIQLQQRAACRTEQNRGVATTELALTLPVLLLLLLGAVDYGRVGYVAGALANAVGASAHYAATHQVTERNEADWNAAIVKYASGEMEGTPGYQPESFHIATTRTVNASDETEVTLDATYLFTPLVDWPGLPGQFQLRKNITVVQYQ